MAARKHPNGEMTLDKESANELLTFIARFNQVLNTTEVSQPTQQAGYDNGRASRQVGPEEDDEQQKQERKETLTREMPGYGAPPPSQPMSACMTLAMPVQVSLLTNSTPRNSSCVLNSDRFTTMEFSGPNSQRSSSSHPGVQPSSARESVDSGITEGGLTRRKAPERNGSQQNDREALMKISDRITTIVQGLKKKPTYTSEEVRTILEEIMEETPIVRDKNRKCRCSKGHINRKVKYLEDDQCDLSANGNATKQTAKRPSNEASADIGEKEVGENDMTKNKRQKPGRLDDDESCA